eukprot:TRINITY_DN1693_c0_g1_i1.p1 TRINITY_DN1693_c0_g1~~TRINITY_DN1693_c0_g1_i1.p1  ORF type:complete len:555 (-),score=136.22 TRINITY_DN1693_c0_g1_i1:147-1811(-)
MYPQRVGQQPMVSSGSSRIYEYLDNVKVEFEQLAHDYHNYKTQKDDYERKLQQQLQELNTVQQTIFELERNHNKIKSQYEEEIIRLRRQLEIQSSSVSGGSFGRPSSPIQSQGSTNTLPSINGGNGAQSVAVNPRESPARPSIDKGNGVNFNYGGATPDKQKLPHVGGTSINIKRPREESHEHSENSDKVKLGERTEKRIDSSPVASAPTPTPPPVHPSEKKVSNDISMETTGSDWLVGYNPGVQTNLVVDLAHNLEHQSVVCCVKFSNDGKYLATGCNKSAQLYDSQSGEKIHTFSDENCAKDGDLYIRSVCFSPDNRLLAAGAEDKTVKIWNVEQKRMIKMFTGHELDIYSLDFSSNGNFIVSGSGDKKAKIWDVERGECLFTLGNDEVGPKDGVTSVAFSPDGRLVAAGSLDKIVRLWDAQSGYFLERYEGHLDSVYSVAFSVDGKSLASGSLDKTLKLWDLAGSRARSRCRSTFSGHKDFVLSVAFSPDGNWLISGSKDRSVQFWDPRSAVTHMMLQGHKNSVISVAVSPSGNQFATGSGDYRARVWKYE